jgi:hypothetical protein
MLIPVTQIKTGYQPQSFDTSIETDVLMFQLLQRLTPQAKVTRTINFNRAVRRLAILGIESQYKSATPVLKRQEFIKRRLGTDWINILSDIYNWGDFVIQDPIWLARKIADILEPLGISYLVGGSVASSLLGENRATQDLDLVINILPQQAPQLISAMSGEFYISESAVFEAIAKAESAPRESSFNVIYLPAIEKADIFVMSNDPFSVSVMDRRQLHVASAESDKGIYIYSAEDIILQKLCWYKLMVGVSETQWRDVLGVLKVQGDRLNFNYLSEWGECLKVADLLAQVLQQSRLE